MTHAEMVDDLARGRVDEAGAMLVECVAHPHGEAGMRVP